METALLKAREEHYEPQAMEEIYYLNQELKKAMDRHEALLSACTSLQIQADEMLIKAMTVHSALLKWQIFFARCNRG